MTRTRGYAAAAARAAIAPFSFDRREPRASDVAIDIEYCGICHSDIHKARDEWGGSIFPMVPGHDIACDVEVVSIRDVNECWERVMKSDVRYRFVIDMATLKDQP